MKLPAPGVAFIDHGCPHLYEFLGERLKANLAVLSDLELDRLNVVLGEEYQKRYLRNNKLRLRRVLGMWTELEGFAIHFNHQGLLMFVDVAPGGQLHRFSRCRRSNGQEAILCNGEVFPVREILLANKITRLECDVEWISPDMLKQLYVAILGRGLHRIPNTRVIGYPPLRN